MENIELLITIGGSIAAWLASEKFLIPWIVRGWKWVIDRGRELDAKNLDSTKELKEIEEKTNETYENQINFLVGQIDHLEKQLLQYSEQLEKLRAKILELNQKLFNKSMEISRLKELTCCNQNCKFRQYTKADDPS